MELWKAIVGLEGLAMVSNEGRIYSLRKGAIAHLRLNHNGYLRANLMFDGKKFRINVSNAVMAAFVGPKPDGYQVNHIDAVKPNNSIGNLEYVTRQQNMDHAKALGLFPKRCGEDSYLTSLTNEEVFQIIDLATIMSQGEIGPIYNVHRSTVGNIVNGKTWSHLTGIGIT